MHYTVGACCMAAAAIMILAGASAAHANDWITDTSVSTARNTDLAVSVSGDHVAFTVGAENPLAISLRCNTTAQLYHNAVPHPHAAFANARHADPIVPRESTAWLPADTLGVAVPSYLRTNQAVHVFEFHNSGETVRGDSYFYSSAASTGSKTMYAETQDADRTSESRIGGQTTVPRAPAMHAYDADALDSDYVGWSTNPSFRAHLPPDVWFTGGYVPKPLQQVHGFVLLQTIFVTGEGNRGVSYYTTDAKKGDMLVLYHLQSGSFDTDFAPYYTETIDRNHQSRVTIYGADAATDRLVFSPSDRLPYYGFYLRPLYDLDGSYPATDRQTMVLPKYAFEHDYGVGVPEQPVSCQAVVTPAEFPADPVAESADTARTQIRPYLTDSVTFVPGADCTNRDRQLPVTEWTRTLGLFWEDVRPDTFCSSPRPDSTDTRVDVQIVPFDRTIQVDVPAEPPRTNRTEPEPPDFIYADGYRSYVDLEISNTGRAMDITVDGKEGRYRISSDTPAGACTVTGSWNHQSYVLARSDTPSYVSDEAFEHCDTDTAQEITLGVKTRGACRAEYSSGDTRFQGAVGGTCSYNTCEAPTLCSARIQVVSDQRAADLCTGRSWHVTQEPGYDDVQCLFRLPGDGPQSTARANVYRGTDDCRAALAGDYPHVIVPYNATGQTASLHALADDLQAIPACTAWEGQTVCHYSRHVLDNNNVQCLFKLPGDSGGSAARSNVYAPGGDCGALLRADYPQQLVAGNGTVLLTRHSNDQDLRGFVCGVDGNGISQCPYSAHPLHSYNTCTIRYENGTAGFTWNATASYECATENYRLYRLAGPLTTRTFAYDDSTLGICYGFGAEYCNAMYGRLSADGVRIGQRAYPLVLDGASASPYEPMTLTCNGIKLIKPVDPARFFQSVETRNYYYNNISRHFTLYDFGKTETISFRHVMQSQNPSHAQIVDDLDRNRWGWGTGQIPGAPDGTTYSLFGAPFVAVLGAITAMVGFQRRHLPAAIISYITVVAAMTYFEILTWSDTVIGVVVSLALFGIFQRFRR